MKYIFVAGAPGSKWSSVVKNIYWSPDIDQTDYSENRTYYHDASGEYQLMHLGTYFDPDMEFGSDWRNFTRFSKDELEKEFDKPFSGNGIRIIKSHIFCHHLDFINHNWPDCPIVLVERSNDSCLGWWVRCGEFNITYPNYIGYYKNLREMSKHIDNQNHDLRKFVANYNLSLLDDNIDLCDTLGIDYPPEEYKQNYLTNNVSVYLHQNVA